MEPSALRDRLSGGLFIPTDLSDPLGRLEDALRKVTAAEPVEQKLNDAVKDGRLKEKADNSLLEAGIRAGVITRDEAGLVLQATAARREVIRVDDFPRP